MAGGYHSAHYGSRAYGRNQRAINPAAGPAREFLTLETRILGVGMGRSGPWMSFRRSVKHCEPRTTRLCVCICARAWGDGPLPSPGFQSRP